MLYILTGFVDNHASKRNRYIIDQHHSNGTTCGPLPNSLYVPDLQCEVNPFETWRKTAKKQTKAFAVPRSCRSISTTEASCLNGVPENIIDYIFLDPPFGQNILYSESSFCWEYFLGAHTNAKPEAIVSKVQRKDVSIYQELIHDVFAECFRVLKPRRWMTIEFSNRSNIIWNAISEAIQSCGFVIADVRIFDKKQGTIRQDMGQSVKKDLIISAYKPDSNLEDRFKLEAGTEDGAWDFVRTHLSQLPIFIVRDEQIEVIVERQNHMLFDRMVAFHVQRGVTVPLPASEFYAGLVRRFPERDGMFFLPNQVAEYDKNRVSVRDVLQLELFISDEASAIHWLRQQLTKKPQSFQEIHPQFIKEIGGWQRYEKPLELSDLLEQSFFRYDGTGDVPSQIHSYLSTNFKEFRNLGKDDTTLQAKAKHRWYVPDPNKAGDLEKFRERTLLKEFEEYRESKLKKLKIFRLEAVRAGFQRAWQQRDYQTIIEVARKIPEEILQEDAKLLMWYDQAITRTGALD
jgi:hypothetical protein